MHHSIVSSLGVSLYFFSFGVHAALEGHCPPLGSVLPAPTRPSSNPAVASAVVVAKGILDGMTAGFNGSALAVGVKSIHEDDLLLEYAYTPPNVDPRGVQKVDSDSVFRLASLSKVFPVLAVLKLKGVDMNDPVTKYVPQLRDLNKEAQAPTAIWTIDWDDITLGALASHMAGIPSDFLTDIQPYANWTDLGFPPDDPSRDLFCSGFLGVPPCNDSVFWDKFGQRPPIYLPFTTPVYANMGWTILGFVIKNVTGLDPGEYIQKTIWGPQGMTHTFPSKPDDKLGFIPVNDPWWNASISFESPAGGYYSSINDLHKFGDAILLNKYLTPSKTRKWLKPVTGTSSEGTFIGMPWEIYRAHNVTKDDRLVEFYTKGGDIITYHSFIVLIPDYDIVITVLTAGPEANSGVATLAWSEVATALLPSIEQASKDEARPIYLGTYTDKATNSSITLALDDSPGLNITSWTIRGVDIFATYLSLNLPPIFPTPPGEVRFRLYPTNIETSDQESWRAVAAIGTPEEIAEEDALFFWRDGSCVTWGEMDRVVYEFLSTDHFVFNVTNGDKGKVATALEAVGYRVTMHKDS